MDYGSMFETVSGVGAVLANDYGLTAVFLPDPAGVAALIARLPGAPLAPPASQLTLETAELLRRYFAGEPVTFDCPIDDRHWTEFGRQVYLAVMAIPYGAVRSYGAIAAQCGRPGAARAVGRLMAANRLPIIIPCHRVVAASGALTGYSAPGGIDTKEKLLLLEGAW